MSTQHSGRNASALQPSRRIRSTFLGSMAALFAICGVSKAEERPPSEKTVPASPAFGFSALEIFRIKHSSTALNAADINGDGKLDLILADNSEGAIHFLLQKPSDKEVKAPERNEIRSDTRFTVEKYFAEKAISSLAVADFNGDGRQDLAYYTDPAGLEIVYQSDSWGRDTESFSIRDGNRGAYALRAADLDGDGFQDLVLLGQQKTYLFYQRHKGDEKGLAQPITLQNAYPGLSSLEIVDLDSDGRLDLVGMLPSKKRSVLVRRQTEGGFAPEVSAEIRPMRSWHLSNLPVDGSTKPTLATVAMSDSRIKLHRWNQRAAESGLGEARLLARRGDDKARELIADVDGDGRQDFIMSSPATAQLHIVFQDATGELSKSGSYPTLTEANGVAALDIDGDKKPEIISVSRKEKAIGIASWDGKRLGFPKSVELPDQIADGFDPLVLESDGKAAYIVTEAEGAKFFLSVLQFAAKDGGWKAEVIGHEAIELGGTSPNEIRLLDANNDGQTDVLVFLPFGEPYLFVRGSEKDAPPSATTDSAEKDAAGEDGAGKDGAGKDGAAEKSVSLFREVSRGRGFGLGQLGQLRPAGLSIGKLSDESPTQMMVSSKDFVRALTLSADMKLQVQEQFRARDGSNYVASVVIDILDAPGPEVVLYDQGTSSLEIMTRQEDGTYSLESTLEMPRFDPRRLEATDLNGDGRDDLVVVGTARIGVFYNSKTISGFEPVGDFAEDQKRDYGAPWDLITGDFNGDGKSDIVYHSAPRYFLSILESQKARLAKRLSFQLFEEKSYMRRTTNLGPRHMIVGDFNGDRLDDLILLIHDRVLLYLQDTTPTRAAEVRSTKRRTQDL